MTASSSMSLPPSSAVKVEHRLGHKKRQRARNRELKRQASLELLDRLPPFHELPLAVVDGNDGDSARRETKTLSDLYRPIDRPDMVMAKEFWAKVPSVCNPNKAVLEAKISDERELSMDRYHSEKYRRKLQHKKERGDITQTQVEELWEKHGKRTNKTNADNDTKMMLKTTEPMQATHQNGKASGSTEGVSLLSNARGQRKAWQVENFVSILWDRLSSYTTDETNDKDSSKTNEFDFTVVDFGCGSGNLCLALAPYFSKIRFVLVDKKSYPLKLVERRANEAGLKNVQVLQFSFSPSNLDSFCIPPMPPPMNERTWFMPPEKSSKTQSLSLEDQKRQASSSLPPTDFDIAIGLHCCGSFTDMVMSLAKSRGADCIVCPCCNGAMTSKTTCGYKYPRSCYVEQFMNQDEYLSMSKAAEDSGIYEAKCLIEYDRALWAKENGYNVQLLKMSPEDCTPKHHVLYLTKKGNA
jgi:2-polyprenyl-3-methyl-5-hydroxy-6-metoxy-1,4-benzoquinol methylase